MRHLFKKLLASVAVALTVTNTSLPMPARAQTYPIDCAILLCLSFITSQPAVLVVFEACGSSSYWAREMEALGHQARLIAQQYVRPFVKRQKNDDAEAIVIAARQPEMLFVAPKTADQQAKVVLFRALVDQSFASSEQDHQRTERMNALRAVLYEFGHVFPVGVCNVKRILAVLENPDCDLHALVVAECQDLLAQIASENR